MSDDLSNTKKVMLLLGVGTKEQKKAVLLKN
jgi:hypothetical protein